MSFPPLLAVLFAGARQGRRRLAVQWLQWLFALLVALASMLGGGMAQAATYNFGNKEPDLDFCSRSGKDYTCTKSPWVNWDDQVVLASGYNLKISGDATATYNQGLSMSGNSLLTVTGNLNLTGVNPPNLKVSGGNIAVEGIFSVGALPHSLTANITAGAIMLGSDRVTVTGNLVSRGAVSISASSRVTGDISGTVVTTDSSVTITGNVTASSKFTLGSGSTVTKNVTAPVFDMQAANSQVTGNIVATTSATLGSGSTVTGDIRTGALTMQADRVSVTGNIVATTSVWMGSKTTVTGDISTGTLTMQADGSKITGAVTATTKMTMGSGNTVTGNVDTGELFLESSRAIITGNARVNWATLEWEGRVTGTIYCKNGTAKGTCDCVTNRSGYAVNTANGPRCEGTAPQGVHHFRITHDGEGDICLDEKITITACANAACTAPHYGGTVSGRLAPFNADFTIDASAGAKEVVVRRIEEGQVVLGLANLSVTAGATVCYQTGNGSNSCAMNFAGGVKLGVKAPNHAAAASGINAIIEARQANESKTACVAAFKNKTVAVQYSCNYNKPKTGSAKLTLGGTALSCGTAGAAISTSFDENGDAKLALLYPDAGEVKLGASAEYDKGLTAKGEGSFITVPARFTIAPASGPIRAGADFDVAITAVNSAGVTTPNFDAEALKAAGASAYGVALDIACRAQAGAEGLFFATAPDFKKGMGSAKARWSEVGKIDLSATLSNFLGVSGLGATGSTNVAGAGKCSGKVGQFIPQYFKVAIERLDEDEEASRTYHYSREPFVLAVTAMNKAGQPTLNYEGNLGYSEAVSLSAVAESGTPFSAPAPGVLSVTSIAASNFEKGRATAMPAYAFTALRTAPRTIRLRATNGKAGTAEVTSAFTATPDPDAAKEATTSIRSGRLRLVNRFGSARGALKMPVIAEIWSGNSWVQHTDDVYTVIPAAAFAIGSHKQSAAQSSAVAFVVTAPNDVKLAGGIGSLTLTPSGGGPGWGDVAANLGTGKNDDSSCLSVPPKVAQVSSGAGKPWLRSANSCRAGNDTDPSARATFGVFAPETKRIIHVREAFN
ncbi:MAG: DUF6701 domain-containing protein [Janthinobacterium lividum]